MTLLLEVELAYRIPSMLGSLIPAILNIHEFLCFQIVSACYQNLYGVHNHRRQSPPEPVARRDSSVVTYIKQNCALLPRLQNI